MRNTHLKVLVAVALAATMLITSSGVAFAADTTSIGTDSVNATVPINGTINALTISVTHPASVAYAINPNLGYEAGAFVAPDIAITNNTAVPINVTVASLTATTGGTLQFQDVASDAKDWANLNTTDSKTYIALGLQIADGTGWDAGYQADPQYAVAINNTSFGSLDGGAIGHMTMVAKYGLTFDQSYTAMHNLALAFSLI